MWFQILTSTDGASHPLFDLDRWGKPPLVLRMHAVVEARLAITQAVTPTAAELAAVGHQPDDIVPWPQFCGKQLFLCCRSREPDMFRACVDACRYRLAVAVRRTEQADGERHELHDFGLPSLQEAAHLRVVLRRHERLAVLGFYVDHDGKTPILSFAAPYRKKGAHAPGLRLGGKLSVADVARRFLASRTVPFPQDF